MTNEIAVLTHEITMLKQQVMQSKSDRLNDSLFSKELAPHYMQMATKIAGSALVPKSYQNKPHDLFLAMALGYQIGMSIEQSIQAIAVINGRACLWGDDMLALCMARPDFEDIIEEPILKGDAVVGYKCIVKRKNRSDTLGMFTIEQAKKARLLSKPGPWTDYPDRMLKLRARGFALRDSFPDALRGIKSREEVEDYIDADYTVVEDNKSLSRTEALKKDVKEKFAYVDQEPEVKQVELEVKPEPEPAPEPEPELEDAKEYHDRIKILIDEKQFVPERLAKALAFYEVESIDELSVDLSKHFINELNKI